MKFKKCKCTWHKTRTSTSTTNFSPVMAFHLPANCNVNDFVSTATSFRISCRVVSCHGNFHPKPIRTSSFNDVLFSVESVSTISLILACASRRRVAQTERNLFILPMRNIQPNKIRSYTLLSYDITNGCGCVCKLEIQFVSDLPVIASSGVIHSSDATIIARKKFMLNDIHDCN